MMFKTPEIQDKMWVDEIIENIPKDTKIVSGDIPFATTFLWKDLYKIKISNHKGFYIKSFGEDENTINFTYPIGNGDVAPIVKDIVNYAFENGKNLCFKGISKEQTEKLIEIFGNKISFTEDRDYAEYIYLSEKLANLGGRKLHSKRNHISKFKKTYNYTFEIINENNKKDAMEVSKLWCEQNVLGQDNGLTHEYCAIKNAFHFYDELDLLGGIIRIDGNPVAMAVGEKISKDAFVIHFEKAVTGYDGLYAMINNEFAKILTDYTYINREEDLGIEGLRKAKLSYKPDILLEEFESNIITKDDKLF